MDCCFSGEFRVEKYNAMSRKERKKEIDMLMFSGKAMIVAGVLLGIIVAVAVKGDILPPIIAGGTLAVASVAPFYEAQKIRDIDEELGQGRAADLEAMDQP